MLGLGIKWLISWLRGLLCSRRRFLPCLLLVGRLMCSRVSHDPQALRQLGCCRSWAQTCNSLPLLPVSLLQSCGSLWDRLASQEDEGGGGGDIPTAHSKDSASHPSSGLCAQPHSRSTEMVSGASGHHMTALQVPVLALLWVLWMLSR